MRKKLTLSVDTDENYYGVDENNNAILLPDDFRKTVITKIELGEFKNGDSFEIDIDKKGDPIRREFDQTVAVHRIVDKRFSREDVIAIVNIAINKVERGEKPIAESLVP